MIIFFIAITGILYATIGKTSIPIKKIEYNENCDFNNILLDSNQTISLSNIKCGLKKEDESLELNVNIIIYSMAVLTFLSWIIFALFGGIGLASVPLDFFVSFKSRPRIITDESIKNRKKILFDEIVELRKMGDRLNELETNGAAKKFFWSKEKREYNRLKNEFTSRFSLAKKEFDILNKNNYIGENCAAVFYYLLIPLGIISSILTILWIIQFICSYFYILKGLKDRRPGYPFLSYLLIFFQDHDVSFLSFLFFSILTLYLLFCVIKGNFQFGVRFLFCWSVHPMKKGKTYMNSFLFNISLVLLGSMAITQFVSDCLSDYIAFTDIDTLFNTLIKNLKFFKYFYRYYIFQYIFFTIFILSFIYFICKPLEKPNQLNTKIINRNKGKDIKSKQKEKKKNNDKETEDGGSQDKKLMDKGNGKKPKSILKEKEEKLDDENNENIVSNSFEEDMK
jgi:LMBR1 domain-containing protein 1